MKQLIEAVICRLRDPAESVAKTAKKLLLELQKCYPTAFKQNYIDSLPNEDERVICSLILDNKFEEATKLIMSTSTSPAIRMAHQRNNPQLALPQTVFNPPVTETLSVQNQSSLTGSAVNQVYGGSVHQSPNFGAIGKAMVIVPTTTG
jgi:hypothetical protein